MLRAWLALTTFGLWKASFRKAALFKSAELRDKSFRRPGDCQDWLRKELDLRGVWWTECLSNNSFRILGREFSIFNDYS